jgi:cytochrome c556
MIRSLLVTSALLLGLSAALAQTDPIAERKGIMRGNGAATRTGTQMVRGEAPFDLAKAKEVFTGISAGMTRFPDLFPENTKTGGDTKASPRIWEDPQGFRALSSKMVQDAQAAGGGNNRPSVLPGWFPARDSQLPNLPPVLPDQPAVGWTSRGNCFATLVPQGPAVVVRCSLASRLTETGISAGATQRLVNGRHQGGPVDAPLLRRWHCCAFRVTAKLILVAYFASQLLGGSHEEDSAFGHCPLCHNSCCRGG